VRDCAALLAAEFRRLDTEQFVLAGRSGVRDTVKRLIDHVSLPTYVANEYAGLNSGVLGLDLRRMRQWAATFCPRAPWWHCVVKSRPASFDWGFADQLVYRELLELQPWVWRPLPCGMHAETQVLQGIYLRHDCGERFQLFPYHGSSRDKMRKEWANADDCHMDTLGAAPRMAHVEVAITHSAGGMQDIAKKLAEYLTRSGPEDACPSPIQMAGAHLTGKLSVGEIAEQVASLQTQLQHIEFMIELAVVAVGLGIAFCFCPDALQWLVGRSG